MGEVCRPRRVQHRHGDVRRVGTASGTAEEVWFHGRERHPGRQDADRQSEVTMRVAIGSDHAGFELKEAVRVFLTDEHHDEVLDVGAFSTEPVDYPDYAEAVGAALREDR